MGRRQILGPPGALNTITPCAACKLLRRRCAQECPFSPYFSPHEPQKFASVHKVFGASNVSKMLLEVPESQRADAANSLVYEANVRLRDPVYGCMGAISSLQQQAQSLQSELNSVRAEIMRYKFRSDAAVMHHQPPGQSSHQASMMPSSSTVYSQGSASTDYTAINDHHSNYYGWHHRLIINSTVPSSSSSSIIRSSFWKNNSYNWMRILYFDICGHAGYRHYHIYHRQRFNSCEDRKFSQYSFILDNKNSLWDCISELHFHMKRYGKRLRSSKSRYVHLRY